ncbi:MAG: ABC transporter ATP-binding protein [Alicyclobacillus sp.]|nr:ABC transporter ATP-binding protein [Alicyclobacillus sp.]
MTDQKPILEVLSLYGGYGRFDVIHNINIHVGRGEAVGLLGPNGAGKTTLLRAIMGMLKQHRGTIRVGGVDVSGMPTHRIARGFAALVPEGRRLFTDQSVEDNLILGALHLRRNHARVEKLLNDVYGLFPILKDLRQRRCSELSGGQQQMVAIGRMLMSDPQVLLLDEPSVALAPVAVEAVAKALIELRQRGCSMLLVEQRVDVATRICDRLYIISNGQIVREMQSDTAVGTEGHELINMYLG